MVATPRTVSEPRSVTPDDDMFFSSPSISWASKPLSEPRLLAAPTSSFIHLPPVLIPPAEVAATDLDVHRAADEPHLHLPEERHRHRHVGGLGRDVLDAGCADVHVHAGRRDLAVHDELHRTSIGGLAVGSLHRLQRRNSGRLGCRGCLCRTSGRAGRTTTGGQRANGETESGGRAQDDATHGFPSRAGTDSQHRLFTACQCAKTLSVTQAGYRCPTSDSPGSIARHPALARTERNDVEVTRQAQLTLHPKRAFGANCVLAMSGRPLCGHLTPPKEHRAPPLP